MEYIICNMSSDDAKEITAWMEKDNTFEEYFDETDKGKKRLKQLMNWRLTKIAALDKLLEAFKRAKA